MKNSNAILLAAGALARLATAAPLDPRQVIVTEIDYTTVFDVVTAGNWFHRKHSSSSTSSAESITTSSTSSAEPTTTSATSTYVAPSSTTEIASPTEASTTSSSSIAPTTSSSTEASSSSDAPIYSPTSYGDGASTTAAPSSSSAASSTASSASATSTASSGSGNGNKFTTNGLKGGLSGYVGIADTDAFAKFSDYIGWYSDYTPTTADVGNVQGIPMLWGDGTSCSDIPDDATRMSEFNTAMASSTPKLMFGFYEPDCDCPMSSNISDPSTGASKWNSYIAPLAAKGTVLGSPSMCKQKDEDWLTPFTSAGLSADWDITSIHINKNTLEGAKEDVEYYASTYGKPLWISEFACVDDVNGFVACTDQTEIDTFINEVVAFFQGNDSVIAYGASNGEGLGTVWPLTDSSTGELTATGTTYINALKSVGNYNN